MIKALFFFPLVLALALAAAPVLVSAQSAAAGREGARPDAAAPPGASPQDQLRHPWAGAARQQAAAQRLHRAVQAGMPHEKAHRKMRHAGRKHHHAGPMYGHGPRARHHYRRHHGRQHAAGGVFLWILLPILAVFLGGGILSYRRSRLLHRSIDRCLGRGGKAPAEMLDALARIHRPGNTALYLGVVSIALGLGLALWLGVAQGGRAAAIGTVPVLFGLGCLLARRLARGGEA